MEKNDTNHVKLVSWRFRMKYRNNFKTNVCLKVLFLFCIGLTLFSCKRESEPTVDEISWLKDNAVRIENIEADYTDTTDLQPLKEIIGDARIVMLGEQTHGDGSTFKAKVRLIKFLHQEMGFDVVAFESGFYDCHKLWLNILDNQDPVNASRQGIYSLWSSIAEVEPLFRYIGETIALPRPLEVAGFDCKFTGSLSRNELLIDLETFLAQNNSALLEGPGWQVFKDVFTRTIASQFYVPEVEEQNTFNTILNELLGELAAFAPGPGPLLLSPGYWIQLLRSTERLAYRNWMDEPKDYTIRDTQMADNLLWLYRNRYQNRKIIVWAATFHIIRNPGILYPTSPFASYPTVTMGNFVWQELGDAVYSIGFTGYRGSYRNVSTNAIKPVPNASVGSLEHFMESIESPVFQYGLINFRNLPESGNWLKERLLSRPLANTEMSADWTKVLDGMFFISTMHPSTMADD